MDEINVDTERGKPDVIKVSAKSRSTAVAGAIAAVMREHHYAEVQAIGAGAVNQAVKALAIAHGYLEGDKSTLFASPISPKSILKDRNVPLCASSSNPVPKLDARRPSSAYQCL